MQEPKYKIGQNVLYEIKHAEGVRYGIPASVYSPARTEKGVRKIEKIDYKYEEWRYISNDGKDIGEEEIVKVIE